MIKDFVVAKWGPVGHVQLPKEFVGKKVWIVTEDDTNELSDLVNRTLLFRKVDQLQDIQLKERFDALERDVKARLIHLEKIVLNTT